MKYVNDLKTKEIDKRKIEITGEVSVEKVETAFKNSLSKIKQNIEIDGFRKGNASESLVLSKVGDISILEDASENILNEIYPLMLEELKLDAIGRPEIQITKIAKGSPLGFKIITYLSPTINLCDYKKIAKEENAKPIRDINVEEKEIDDVILNLRKNVAHQKMHENDNSDSHNHGEIKDEDLPNIDEQFLKLFGDFKSEQDFRDKIKENLLKEKEIKEKDKKRTELLSSLLNKSQIEMPEILVLGEIDKIKAEFTDDLNKAGINLDDYLKHIKKTEEDLKKEWTPIAENRAKTQILLYEISKKEDIKPEEEQIKKEMDNILNFVKGADRFRVRMYVENFLTNDLTIKFLESII